MSKILINQYYQNLDRTLQFGKSRNEQSIRNHFWHLLNDYARKSNYEVVPEVAVMGTRGKKVYPDGTVKNLWGLDIGLWESKDEKDDIEAEIDAKIKKGYPLTNILFEDSNVAVLFQRGEEVGRAKMRDADQLHDLLSNFINFKSETVYKFEEAIEKFKADIPIIVETLRKKIVESREKNLDFQAVQNTFLELCKAEINPDITLEDIREMMIQHLLTSDIFNRIFDDPDFHRHNTIAAELEKLIETLFNYAERRNLLNSIEHYYDAINSTAAGITDHHEKQKFLKVLYENFYKVYNPKAADRLGVVYTPNEIVRFMVDSTNYLLHKHFGKTLADRNVEILDPSTGTGTYICDIIEHAIPKHDLAYKYKNELFANEVAILPYYIANLNIEYTFKQKMQYYEEFPNLCFVDTLDNVTALKWDRKGKDQGIQTRFFNLSSENTERIRRQNSKKISVVIGNPPYNANQLNENENNKNRTYPVIDNRIKETYIKYSTAQKTKVYDMYSRFYRWAMDRIDQNGVLAMITNRSFIDSRTFDGFRKCVLDEYAYAYIVDTKSDVRTNPKIAGTTHNVFGIQTGVAIMFLIKKEKKEGPCQIEYVSMEDDWRKEIKLDWLKNNQLANIHFETIHPDKTNNWIKLSEDNDWENLLTVADKDVKLGKSKNSLFELFSLGVVTARDEWVYDEKEAHLKCKVQHLINVYNIDLEKLKGKDKSVIKDEVDYSIKWSRAVKNDLFRGKGYKFDESAIINSLYRPYVKRKLYFSQVLNEMQYQLPNVFKDFNLVICINQGNEKFASLASSMIFDFAQLKFGNGQTQCLPLYRYDKSGNRTENITDWGLEQFRAHYGWPTPTPEEMAGERLSIFHYTYAVLHNPAYRKKYELNLKREFPRIPFYNDFRQWADWGKALMELHIGYETVEPFALEEIITETKAEHLRQKTMFNEAQEPEAMFVRKPKVKAKLKADKDAGIIEIDELTYLKGIPKIAWEYKLGNRSALEWVLDQYKEKKPKDPTISEKFDTYRFADYKIQVIDLLKRVCTVSVETMKIVGEMESNKS
jgi:predicted helicase